MPIYYLNVYAGSEQVTLPVWVKCRNVGEARQQALEAARTIAVAQIIAGERGKLCLHDAKGILIAELPIPST